MYDDGDVVVPRRREPVAFVTYAILAVSVLVFLCQSATPLRNHPMLDEYFALSLHGLKKGYVWQLLTFQFMHGSITHIFFNSVVIYVFGRIVEMTMGWRYMLKLYFASGTIGGLTQMAGTLLLPSLFPDNGVVGASAGASGLIASFAVLYPEQIIYMLLVVLPLRMKARSFLFLSITLAVVGILYPILIRIIPALHVADDLFVNIGHAAHLGGIITGYIMGKTFLMNRVHSHASPAAKPPVIKPGDYNTTVLRD